VVYSLGLFFGGLHQVSEEIPPPPPSYSTPNDATSGKNQSIKKIYIFTFELSVLVQVISQRRSWVPPVQSWISV
jgi:hypothetical protein